MCGPGSTELCFRAVSWPVLVPSTRLSTAQAFHGPNLLGPLTMPGPSIHGPGRAGSPIDTPQLISDLSCMDVTCMSCWHMFGRYWVAWMGLTFSTKKIRGLVNWAAGWCIVLLGFAHWAWDELMGSTSNHIGIQLGSALYTLVTLLGFRWCLTPKNNTCWWYFHKARPLSGWVDPVT